MIPPKIARLYENIFLNRRKPKYTRAPNGSLDCFIAYNNIGGYAIPRSKIKSGPAQAIMAGSVWEPDLLQFICSNAKGDVIHAGAFFGDGLPTIDEYLTAGSRLWAFEPSEMYDYAVLTKLINKLDRTIIYRRALSDKINDIEATIDSIIPKDRHVGLIHLDIEGDEQKALDGARETIVRCRPILVVEEVFLKIEPPKGYTRVKKFGNNTVLR